jgi:DNA mismatch repair ATPase MutL
VIFDLRAAAANVAMERLALEIANGEPHRQKLLVPISIDLRNLDVDAVEDKLKYLEATGFSIGRSGSKKFSIGELPAWIDGRSAEAFIYDWISAKLEIAAPWHETMAAIAAGRTMAEKLPSGEGEVVALLAASLKNGAVAAACIEISTAEIDRRLRIVIER